jgi:L-lactate dehydrogenase complex protein LldF
VSSRAFRKRVTAAIADRRVAAAVHHATWHKVVTRAAGMKMLRNPERLRELAGQIKQHTLERLPEYLAQFTENVRRNGGHVHFARDAAAARQLICELARSRGLKLAVKVKSMTTEEVGLNPALQAAGLQVFETDLGEFIVQIDRDRPSHIVTPIIHKDRRQIATAMARELGCEYTEDPTALTMIARKYLRDVFRRCDLGISGVNFGVAETGTICICTNEGNGRMSTTRPRVHVALMGIEKVIPRLSDLAVFLKLLARSSTGQPMGSYTSLITGPRRADDADGPTEFHLVLLDNGRSDILAGPFAEVLRCVRCGACLNACPVYRNIGGHAYHSVYPGPIGSVVTPLLNPGGDHHDLPRASSLCGACAIACPVKIDLPGLLVRMRAGDRAAQGRAKQIGIRGWLWAMRSEKAYRAALRIMRAIMPGDDAGWTTHGLGPIGSWTAGRDLLQPAPRSFRQLWQEELGDES